MRAEGRFARPVTRGTGYISLAFAVIPAVAAGAASTAFSRAAAIIAAFLLAASYCTPGSATPAPDDALVYFIWPADGAVIKGGRFWLRMGLRNMGVAPKGVAVPQTGHHHLLIDAPLTPAGEAIPSDRNHLHFGAGETEARIELPPGRHSLQLLLGDQNHLPHAPPVYSKPIYITVVR